MGSAWKTRTVVMQGGTRLDLEPVLRDATLPGSLIDSQNFESGQAGGYARIKGYDLYDADEVPGTDRILGCFVHNNGVLACRNAAIYFSTGSGWSADIAPSARTGAGQYRASKYTWSSERIVLVDSVNRPVRFVASTGTTLTNAPLGATCVREFKNHLFFAVGGVVTYSAPNDDTTYSGGGSGTFTIGDTVQNFGVWRGRLYIFCENSIHRLSGNNSTDFELEPVTGHLGCTFPDTVIEVAGDIVFLAPDGIRKISSTDQTEEVAIDNLSNPITETIDTHISTYEDAGRICAVTVESKSQYRLFFSDEDVAVADTPGVNMCLVKNQGAYDWEFFNLKGIQAVTADHGQINDGQDELVIHAAWDGYIYQQESGNNFAGSNITAFIQLGYLVFDDPAVRKILHRLRLYVTTEGNALSHLTTQVYLDDNDANVLQPAALDMTTNTPSGMAIYGYSTSLYGTAVYGRGASQNYRIGLHGGGFNISVKISSDDTRPAYAIKTAIMEYSLGARQ